MYPYGFGWWGFPFFPLIWIVFWLIIIFFFFGRWRRWDRYHHHGEHTDKSAEEVLADRFANGEIDEKEYEHRLEVLKKHNSKK